MLKLRNLTLLRRFYVMLLTYMTRIAYGSDGLTTARRARPRPDDSRIRRINSELEFGPGIWEGAFLDAFPTPLPPHRDWMSSTHQQQQSPLQFSSIPSSGASPTEPSVQSPETQGNQAQLQISACHPRPPRSAVSPASPVRSPGRTLPPFALADTAVFVADAIDAILGDSLTGCFNAEPPEPWNFLTRNLPPGRFSLSPYMTLMWLIGLWVRYCVLLPVRVIILLLGVLSFLVAFPLVKLIPSSFPATRTLCRQWLLRYLASVFVASWSGVVRFHGSRPTRRPNQIYVANHTSLIDVIVLMKDYNFSFIGQRHGGLAGMLQTLLLAVQDHVWFDREEGRDRRVVQQLLKDYVMDGNNEPMLVFPEGTCSTSDYCVMFKKGSFELGAIVYPIALKFRKEYGDPYWNSSLVSFPRHFFDLMTSWAVVCDVYYLPPTTIQQDETAVQFAKRVKQDICKVAGLVDVNWDGFLKRHRISPKYLEQRQKAFAAVIMRRLKGDVPRPFSTSAVTALPRDHRARIDAASPLEGSSLDDGHIGTPRRRLGRSQREPDEDMIDMSTFVTGEPTRNTSVVRPVRTSESSLNRTLASLVGAMENFFRWGVAFTLLAIAGGVTAYIMPRSWRNMHTWRKVLFPAS